MSLLAYKNYLAHHGILGQKWGVRRFQNEDGSLTPEGRKRYGSNKDALYGLVKSGLNSGGKYTSVSNLLASMMTEEQLSKSMELTKIHKEYDYKFDHVDATDKNGNFNMEKFIQETDKIREKYKKDYLKPITELSVEILGNKSIDDSSIQMLIRDASKSEWAKKLKSDSIDKNIIEKSGFKADKYGNFEKKLSNGVDLTIETDPGVMPGKNILMAASDYEKNQKSHDKVVLDAVRKELSNRTYFDLDDKQLDDVMSKLEPAGVSMQEFNGHIIGEISFFDPTYTNHWFDTEYDFTKKKASDVAMNG